MAQPVVITTTGSTFNPKVALTSGSGATVTWSWSGGSTTGLTPSINFGSAATRTVSMTAADANGNEAIDQVTVFNLGFDHTQDAGTYNIGSSYDKTSEAVTAVAGIHWMEGLQIFCAAGITGLTGTLDFTGLAQLQYIECFGSRVQAVILAGCASLIRLCMEANNLTTLDLNPVAATLKDCRAAAQQGGALTFAPLDKVVLQGLYHMCTRDNATTGLPDPGSQMPALQQLWAWDSWLSGALAPVSTALNSVRCMGNEFTSADFTNAQITGGGGEVLLSANLLTSCTLTGCTGLTDIDLEDNNFSQSAVDSILATVDGFSTSGGSLLLTGNPAPSSTGNTHKSNLQGRSWTVTTGPGSISVVQTAHAGAGPLSFGSNVTAGHAVYLVVGAYTTSSQNISSSSPTLNGNAVTGANAIFNFTSNGINSGFNSGYGTYIAVWELPNVPGGVNGLNVTLSNGTLSQLVAFEVAGLASTPTHDGSDYNTGTNTGTATGSIDSRPCVSGQAAFVLGVAQIFNQSSAPAASPWTSPLSGTLATWAGYRFCTGTNGENFRWRQTATANGPWSAGIVAVS